MHWLAQVLNPTKHSIGHINVSIIKMRLQRTLQPSQKLSIDILTMYQIRQNTRFLQKNIHIFVTM
nr:unnamed protein product [Callosobruchus analis]